MNRLLRWFRDSLLGIRFGLLATTRSNSMSLNVTQQLQSLPSVVQTISITDDAFMPAIPDILRNTGDVFILSSLLTHCFLTRDVYLQTIIRMPAWIFLTIICSSAIRLQNDRFALAQEILRLGIIIIYGLRLNFCYKVARKKVHSDNEKDNNNKEKVNGETVPVAENSDIKNNVEKTEERLLSEDEVQRFYKGVPTLVRGNEPVAYTTLPFDKTLEISDSHFTTTECMQQRRIHTHNGTCFLGMLNYNDKKIRACIKTNLPGDVNSLRGLMKEIKLLKFVGQHDNLQTIFGACTKDIDRGNLFLVLENCGSRSLAMHLHDTQKTESPTSIREDLLIDFYRWAYEISSGMKFISSKHIVHGKLTCECILVDEVGTVKLTDYGTAPFLTDKEKFKPDEMENGNWKYFAPESIVKHDFTSSSDVWSFGVVLWKIFTMNSDPFPSFQAYSSIFPLGLLDGMRPEADERIPSYINELIAKCWLQNPERRPDFDTCCQVLYVKTKPKRRIVAIDGDFIT